MAEVLRGFWGVVFVVFLVLSKWVDSHEFEDSIFMKTSSGDGAITPTPLLIALTLIQGAAAKGAGKTHTYFCLLYFVLDLCSFFP